MGPGVNSREYQHAHCNQMADPLLRELYVSSPNLNSIDDRICDLFKFCDVDESGDLNFDEFRDGLRKLPFDPLLSFSAEDWGRFGNFAMP